MKPSTRIILAIALAATALPTFGETIRFQQAGWTEAAGPLVVAFSGADSNGDGAIVLGELTAFDAAWITPQQTQTFWTLTDLEQDGFFFENLGSYVFLATNPEYSLVSVAFEGEALASVFDQFLFPVSDTVSPASEVPEPGTFALLAAAATLSILPSPPTAISSPAKKA